MLKQAGPLLLACNHPNSFLDGVILDTLFSQPIYSLARGDVFKKPIYKSLLTSLKLLPVYRKSEGTENLPINYDTFDNCIEIFKQNGIIIIFSEGKCINEWRLRPLRKGTARLAFSAWAMDIPLKVLPIGINYSSFRRFGKNVFINFGEPINKDEFDITQPGGVLNLAFNSLLEQQLKELVYDIDKTDKTKQSEILKKNIPVTNKIFLSIPAILGFISHWPLYLPVKMFTLKRTMNTDHYDSVLTGILLLLYPVYLLIVTIAVYFITDSWYSILVFLLLPFMAWAYVQLKPQLDRESN